MRMTFAFFSCFFSLCTLRTRTGCCLIGWSWVLSPELRLEPLVCEVLEVPDLEDLGQLGLPDQGELGAGVHDHHLGLAVARGAEDEAHGVRDPTGVLVVKPEAVDHEPGLALRQLLPELLRGDVIQDLLAEQDLSSWVDLHDNGLAGLLPAEAELFEPLGQLWVDGAHGHVAGHE